MVRKKSWVWIHYKEEIVTTAGNKRAVRGRCNYCGWRGTNSADRLLEHLAARCSAAPMDVKDAAKRRRRVRPPPEEGEALAMAAGSSNKRGRAAGAAVSGDEGLSGGVQYSLLPAQEVERLQEMFATAIYYSALPLGAFDSQPWRDFFRRLSPDFQLPGKWKLSTTLLDREYQRVRAAVEARVRLDDLELQPAAQYLAELLDPRQCGSRLSIQQMNEATEHIKTIVPAADEIQAVNASLSRYLGRSGEFGMKIVWERLELQSTMTARDWWADLPPQVAERARALQGLALRVLGVEPGLGSAAEDLSGESSVLKLHYVTRHLRLMGSSAREPESAGRERGEREGERGRRGRGKKTKGESKGEIAAEERDEVDGEEGGERKVGEQQEADRSREEEHNVTQQDV